MLQGRSKERHADICFVKVHSLVFHHFCHLGWANLSTVLLPSADSPPSSTGKGHKLLRWLGHGGKIDSWHLYISRLLITQWLGGTLILPTISIAHYKQIMDGIQSALIHSLSIRSIFYLLRQFQRKTSDSGNIPSYTPGLRPEQFPLTFHGFSALLPWALGFTECTQERNCLTWGWGFGSLTVSAVCGALGPRLARPVCCFSAGQCFSFLCL